MKRILALAIAILLFAGMACIGTFAYFSDVTESADNVMAAGTLLIKTNDKDGVSQTLRATNMAPGDVIGPQTVTLKNAGSVDATSLDFTFSYIEADGPVNPVNMSADATAGQLEVTTLSYGGSSILGTVTDMNSNGYIDIYDLKNDDLSGYAGIAAGASKNFTIAVRLRPETGHEFQNDGIEVTMTFILKQ